MKTQFGYHIIQLEDTRAAQFPPLADVKPQITAAPRRSRRRSAFRDELRAKAKTDYKFELAIPAVAAPRGAPARGARRPVGSAGQRWRADADAPGLDAQLLVAARGDARGRGSPARSVVPASRLSSNISAITVSPVAKSRLPVGSSASSSAGWTTKARASATRCCSPPESTLRIVAQPLAQADAAQHLGRQRPRVGAALQLERQHHVLERVQVAEQLEALEHEADLGGAHRGARVLVDREQVDAGEPHGARWSACRARR